MVRIDVYPLLFRTKKKQYAVQFSGQTKLTAYCATGPRGIPQPRRGLLFWVGFAACPCAHTSPPCIRPLIPSYYIPKASSSRVQSNHHEIRHQRRANQGREGGRESGGWGSARVSAGRRRRRSTSGGRRRTGASRRTPAPRLPRPRRGGKPSQSPNHPPGPPAGI